jgi:hypothetical protein
MKPILFNTEMVKAILDGRKTTTRRVIKPQPYFIEKVADGVNPYWRVDDIGTKGHYYGSGLFDPNRAPEYAQFQKGNVLYVRETFGTYRTCGGISYVYKAEYTDPENLAKAKVLVKHWHPSIHMPKEAARIFLRVTDVKAKRLQDITDGGAEKEGCADATSTAMGFPCVWDSTVNKSDLDHYGWSANPWVWVISFERTACPDEK